MYDPYGPTYPYPEEPRRPRWPWVVGGVGVLMAVALVTAAVTMIARPTHSVSGSSVLTTTTPATSTSTITITAPAPPPPPPPPEPTYSGSGPEVAAANRLNQIVADDNMFVSEALSDSWVPQLSSKKSGTADDGGVYDNIAILNEHLKLRSDYGAKLLVKNGYWVSVAPYPYSTKAGADNWCASMGRDSWHCFGARI